MTPNTQADNQDYFGESEVQIRPKAAVTFVIRGIEDAKTTASGDYEMAKINTESTRGGRKFFSSILFRTEQFTPGFSPKMYTHSDDEGLNEIREGKDKSVGSIFSIVYRNNVMPAVKTDKNGNKTPEKVTVLMALTGGTLESLAPFKSRLAVLKGVEPTAEQVISLLRDQINSQNEVEQVAILKQQKDQNGELTDNYELDQFLGPLTTELQKRLVAQAKKNENNPDVSKRLQLYSLD